MPRKLTTAVVRAQGSFDRAGRYTFDDPAVGDDNRCYVCKTTLRSPSRRFPYSVYKHAFTAKHAKACLAAGLVTEADLED